MKLKAEDIALAYELIATGHQLKQIARGLGVHPDTLRRSMKKADTDGLRAFQSYGY